ncbi:MAG: hypothetical protein ACOX5M_06105 [Bacillota bacterium]
MDLLRRLGETDNRVLYVLLVLVLLIPMVKPLGLPLQVSDATRNTFNIVEKLKPGDTVIFDFGYYVDGGPDVQPNAVALFEYLFSKDIKIICFSYKSHGPMIVDDLTAKYEAAGKQYGVDFVNMGYLAGAETALAAYARDIKAAFPKDWRGNVTSTLPILKGINSVADADLYVFFTDDSAEAWVRQIAQYKVPLIATLITVTAPQAEPFIQSGQLAGLLAGLRAAAEFELLMDKPGSAAAGMDAQSMGHMLLILFILFGNLSYFVKKSQGLAGKGAGK